MSASSSNVNCASVVRSGKETDINIVPLADVSTDEDERIKTQIQELDRVLGGGIVEGSLVLVGGDPGIGKSTLLLQVCQKLSSINKKVLYISGEESLKQIKLQQKRRFSDSRITAKDRKSVV